MWRLWSWSPGPQQSWREEERTHQSDLQVITAWGHVHSRVSLLNSSSPPPDLSRRSFTALTSVENSISMTVFFFRSSQIITAEGRRVRSLKSEAVWSHDPDWRAQGSRTDEQLLTFVCRIFGFLPSSHQSQVVTSEQHLHVSDPTLQELWKFRLNKTKVSDKRSEVRIKDMMG